MTKTHCPRKCTSDSTMVLALCWREVAWFDEKPALQAVCLLLTSKVGLMIHMAQQYAEQKCWRLEAAYRGPVKGSFQRRMEKCSMLTSVSLTSCSGHRARKKIFATRAIQFCAGSTVLQYWLYLHNQSTSHAWCQDQSLMFPLCRMPSQITPLPAFWKKNMITSFRFARVISQKSKAQLCFDRANSSMKALPRPKEKATCCCGTVFFSHSCNDCGLLPQQASECETWRLCKLFPKRSA